MSSNCDGINRGFGLEIENNYGEDIDKDDFNLDWFIEADSVDFKLNDEPVVKSGSSRMNRRARAGVLKPTGSTQADADLQRFAWYFRAYLDQYKFTEGEDNINTHEFWGGECKELTSFRAIAVYDMLKKYIYGLLCDGLSFEVSDESMSISTDWIYKTEKAGIIGEDGETFTKPNELINDLFLMFYDTSVFTLDTQLKPKPFDGISTSFSFEGNNNHDVDSTIGMGSRAPQKRAQAQKRENNVSIVTSLTRDTVREILNAQYGEVDALEPSKCKLLQIPLGLHVELCEVPDICMDILFPKCTLNVEFDMSGADRVEVTMNMVTLGTNSWKLMDNTEIITDMYVKLVNNQPELVANESP